MPNRILRDWTDSERVNTLDWQAECLFARLIMKADDYGRYNANPKLLRSLLFPLRDGIRDSDISRWLAACEAAGLIRVYQVQDKPFLEIGNFKQRTRASVSKFPAPDSDQPQNQTCQTDDGQVTVKRPSDGRQLRTYSETETETETETGKERVCATPGDKPVEVKPEKNPYRTWKREDLARSVEENNKDGILSQADVEDFLSYWCTATPSGKLYFTTKETWNTRLRMQTAKRMVYDKQSGRQREEPRKVVF